MQQVKGLGSFLAGVGASPVTPKAPRAFLSHVRTPSCGIGCGDGLVTVALLAARCPCQARAGPRRSGQEQTRGWETKMATARATQGCGPALIPEPLAGGQTL